MKTQRNIALIVMAVLLVCFATVSGLVWWLGITTGSLVATGAALVLLLVYLLVVRPWHLTWGASPAEATAAMPGDELVPGGTVSTRAITVEGAPADVWPWLVQIGFGRAGWYSYDWIDNDGERSADRVIPALQDLAVGDQIEVIPGMGPKVVSIDSKNALVCAADDRTSSWCLQLVPEATNTRLISRWRNDFDVTPASAFIVALTDPGAFIMEQKMLRTIRDRVERQLEVAS